MYKYIIILIITLNFAGNVQGSVPVWDKTFGGVGDESAASVQQTSDGGYIIAGATFTYGAGGSDVWLIKTDQNGTRSWDRTFGGKNNESASYFLETTDGGYAIAATTFTYGNGGSDVWFIKTDSEGNKQVDRTYGGKGFETASSIQQTSDGGYIISGTTSSYGAGGADAWLLKIDSKGNRQWDRTFGGVDNDYGISVKQTPDGGYVLAGTTFSYGAGGSDIWLIRVDSNGKRIRDTFYGGPGNDSAVSVVRTDGGYVIAGTTFSYGAGGSDIWLIGTDPEGTRLWDRTIGGTGDESAASIEKTSDDGYIIAGTTFTYGAGGSDAWLIKTNSSGIRLWDKTFGGIDDDSASSARQISDNSYILAGTTFSYGAGSSDAWLLEVQDETTELTKTDKSPSKTIPSAASEKAASGFMMTASIIGMLAAIYLAKKIRI